MSLLSLIRLRSRRRYLLARAWRRRRQLTPVADRTGFRYAGPKLDFVEREQPFDCCGSYRVERLGITLFESVEGEDFTAIEGLPLIAVSRMLRKAGVQLP